MRPRLLLLFGTGLFLLLASFAQADTSCTLVVRADTGEVVHRDGPCVVRNSPASTFKVALAVMGYDSGLLTDAHTPSWPYQESYHYWSEAGRKSIDPTSWLHDSIVWYSQVLTGKLGKTRFQNYVDAFAYGNRDLSGTPDGRDGLPPAMWVSSSLAISPAEQVAFLRRLLDDSLPVSREACEKTRAIVPLFPPTGGWTVHGKTGTGFQKATDGSLDRDRQFGWFVGWADNGKQTVVFARLVKEEQKRESYAGPRTRDSLLADLPALLSRL